MDQLECALDLMRRLPPADIEDNLGGLIDLCPDLTEDLLAAVDQPLAVEQDPSSGRDFLLCDYNRDGDSYRSPWSNKYFPELDDGALPSDKLRSLEVSANEMFDAYRDQYYVGGISSVYMWDLDDGFAACILIKKSGDQGKKAHTKGTWDSIHVIEVVENGANAHYKLTSTVMLAVTTASHGAGNVNLSGSITRQMEEDRKFDDKNGHLVNMGQMVEAMEARLRNSLEEIYFGKTKSIVNDVRAMAGLTEVRRREELQASLKKSMADRMKR